MTLQTLILGAETLRAGPRADNSKKKTRDSVHWMSNQCGKEPWVEYAQKSSSFWLWNGPKSCIQILKQAKGSIFCDVPMEISQIMRDQCVMWYEWSHRCGCSAKSFTFSPILGRSVQNLNGRWPSPLDRRSRYGIGSQIFGSTNSFESMCFRGLVMWCLDFVKIYLQWSSFNFTQKHVSILPHVWSFVDAVVSWFIWKKRHFLINQLVELVIMGSHLR